MATVGTERTTSPVEPEAPVDRDDAATAIFTPSAASPGPPARRAGRARDSLGADGDPVACRLAARPRACTDPTESSRSLSRDRTRARGSGRRSPDRGTATRGRTAGVSRAGRDPGVELDRTERPPPPVSRPDQPPSPLATPARPRRVPSECGVTVIVQRRPTSKRTALTETSRPSMSDRSGRARARRLRPLEPADVARDQADPEPELGTTTRDVRCPHRRRGDERTAPP